MGLVFCVSFFLLPALPLPIPAKDPGDLIDFHEGIRVFSAARQEQDDSENIRKLFEAYFSSLKTAPEAWPGYFHENSPTLASRAKKNLNPFKGKDGDLSGFTISSVNQTAGRDRIVAEVVIKFEGQALPQMHYGLIREAGLWKIWHESSLENWQLAQQAAKGSMPNESALREGTLEIISGINWAAYLAYEKQDYSGSIAAITHALELSESTNDDETLVSSSILLGHGRLESGEASGALGAYQRAKQVAKKANYWAGEVRALSGIGNAANRLGKYFEARNALEERLALLRGDGGSPRRIAVTLNNLGNTYNYLGEYEKAISLYSESIGIEAGYPDAHRNIGYILIQLGKAGEAKPKFDEALSISTNAGDFRGIVMAKAGLAATAWALGDYEKAGSLLEELSDESVGVKDLQVSGCYLLSRIALDRSEIPKAVKYAEKGLALGEAAGLKNSSWYGQFLLAQIYKADGKKVEARRLLRESVASIERILEDNTQLESLENLFKDKVEPYRELVENLVQAGEFEEALAIAEMSKARSLLKALRGNAPGAVSPVRFGLPMASKLAKSPDTAFVEFVVAKDSVVLLLIVREGKMVKLYAESTPYGREMLRGRVDQFRSKISSENYDLSDDAEELYKILFSKIEKKIAAKKKIVVVPDGPLWALPFQALKIKPSEFLIERYSIDYARSLNTLILEKKGNAKRSGMPSLLAVTNPSPFSKGEDLPFAAKSGLELSTIYGVKQTLHYSGGEATEKNVASKISDFGIVHFATHGFINEASPLSSYLLLASGERLEANEIQNLKINADLVVLAGCETGLGKEIDGEGMMGLTWALERAGAASAVVSQWKVRDRSTMELLVDFHRISRQAKLEGRAEDFSESLRRAVILQQKRRPHPLFWSGFVVVGSGQER